MVRRDLIKFIGGLKHWFKCLHNDLEGIWLVQDLAELQQLACSFFQLRLTQGEVLSCGHD